MVDREYRKVDYKSPKISIEVVIKNPELLKFVADHLKTKTMRKHANKRLRFVIRYVPNQYQNQQICDKAILENGGTLESAPDCYKNQQMCDKSVSNNPHALVVFPDCYMTQKCVTKLSILILLQYNLLLNAIKLKKCVIVFDSLSP